MAVKLLPGSEQKNSCLLEQLAVGLFAWLSRWWSFPVDLPDQVIEDLQRRKDFRVNTGTFSSGQIKMKDVNWKNVCNANHRYLIFND